MKGRTVVGIIGWGVLGLMLLSFVLRALWQVESGQDIGYSNYKNQPMTYLGALASLAIAALVGVIGLYYRIKKVIESRRDRQTPKAAEDQLVTDLGWYPDLAVGCSSRTTRRRRLAKTHAPERRRWASRETGA